MSRQCGPTPSCSGTSIKPVVVRRSGLIGSITETQAGVIYLHHFLVLVLPGGCCQHGGGCSSFQRDSSVSGGQSPAQEQRITTNKAAPLRAVLRSGPVLAARQRSDATARARAQLHRCAAASCLGLKIGPECKKKKTKTLPECTSCCLSPSLTLKLCRIVSLIDRLWFYST